MTKLEMEENDRWAKKWAGVATVIILFLIITSAVWKTIYPDKAPTIILVSGIVEQSHIGFEGKGRTSYPSVRIIGDASVYVFDPIHVEVGMPDSVFQVRSGDSISLTFRDSNRDSVYEKGEQITGFKFHRKN